MQISLETISKIVAQVTEKPYRLLRVSDRFDELEIDSLGLLMVIVGVASECNIDGTEKMIVKLVNEIGTVGDIIDYVASHPG